MQDYKKLIGQRVKQIRKSRNLTQEKLAELIDIEIPSMSYIETGKFAPSIETLQKLSRVLEVKPWEFYFFETLSNEDMLTEIINSLEKNPHYTQTVYHFLKTLKTNL